MNRFLQGYYATLEKLGVLNTHLAKRFSKIDNQDGSLPAGLLATELEKLEEPPKRKNLGGYSTVEQRLNRETEWSDPIEVTEHMATGASPYIPGAF